MFVGRDVVTGRWLVTDSWWHFEFVDHLAGVFVDSYRDVVCALKDLIVGCCVLTLASLAWLHPSASSENADAYTAVFSEAKAQQSATPAAVRREEQLGDAIFQDGQGTLRIPTPIFVTSLPKSGTTSTWKYFACGLGPGQSAHTFLSVPDGVNKTKTVRMGRCFYDNMKQQLPLLEGCGDYQVIFSKPLFTTFNI